MPSFKIIKYLVSIKNLALIGQAVLEKKIFENNGHIKPKVLEKIFKVSYRWHPGIITTEAPYEIWL